MEVSVLLLVTLLGSRTFCSRIPAENNVWEQDYAFMGALEPDSSTGPEKMSIQILADVRNGLEEEQEQEEGETGKEIVFDVDEETIRKAEKMADKDLLNGLNRILKNNQTLKDVFQAENIA